MEVYKDVNDCYEKWANVLLNEALANHYRLNLNNLESNDIDLAIWDNEGNKKKIDVQYSFNFQKYGDVRIDLMSAGFKNKDYLDLSTLEINEILKNTSNPYKKLQEVFNIRKKGKYFEHNDLLGVFYFLYNGKKPENYNLEKVKSTKIDYMFFLPFDILIEELNNPRIKHIYKVNDKTKNGLSERHDSAFMCINLREIVKHYKIPIFRNRKELQETLFPIVNNSFKKHLENKENLLKNF